MTTLRERLLSLASATAATDTSSVPELLTGLAPGMVFALPWILAAVWVCYRGGWSVLWSENGKEFSTQATRLGGFGHR